MRRAACGVRRQMNTPHRAPRNVHQLPCFQPLSYDFIGNKPGYQFEQINDFYSYYTLILKVENNRD